MPFRWIYSKLMFVLGGLFAPMEMYPASVARLARALPFNYMLYAPARLFVRYDTALFWNTIAMQTGWIAVMGGVDFWPLRLGGEADQCQRWIGGRLGRRRGQAG